MLCVPSIKKRQSGFTLIELLVVIAIIGVLASTVLASLNSARAKARDAQRRLALTQIQNALELYRDEYGTYQVVGGGWSGGGQGWLAYEAATGAYPTAVTRVLHNEGYLPTPIVDDPLQNPGYMIYLCNGGQSYAISATLENPTAEDISGIQASCNGVGSNGTYTRYGKNVARYTQ